MLGCTDSRQATFDFEATYDDGSCPVLLGCTDSTAATFRALATVDDGSCKYAGCRDPRAINYESAAVLDGGGCVAAIPGCTAAAADNRRPLANLLVTSGVGRCERGGCTDPLAPNYGGTDLTYDDGSCVWYAIGCTNPRADNYRSIALHDDGSCVVSSPPPPPPPSPKPPPPPATPPLVPCAANFAYELMWQEEGGGLFQGRIVASPWPAHQAIVLELPSCSSCLLLYTLGDGDATLVSLRAGWAYFVLGDGADPIRRYVEFVGRRNAHEPAPTAAEVSCDLAPPRPPAPPPQPPPAGRRLASDGTSGCTYPSASNFDSAATHNDASCVWTVVGCADSDALTFVRDATVHDASACVFARDQALGCLAPTATNFDSAADRSHVELCAFERIGCTDPTASNYASDTTLEAAPGESGECVYFPSVLNLLDAADSLEAPGGSVVYAGCTIPAAINYAAAATVDDGSCVLPVAGCADSAALNYAADVTIDDGSCVPLRMGCLLPSASNYDDDATRDDGSCHLLTPPPLPPPPPPDAPPRQPPPPPSPPMPTTPPPACLWREELRPCTGLVADATAASAIECEAACCTDDGCRAWQFDTVGSSGGVCSRGTPGLCSSSLGRRQQHGGIKLDADAANATVGGNASAGPPPPTPGAASTEVWLGMGAIELSLALFSASLLAGSAVLAAWCSLRTRGGRDAYPRVAPHATFAPVVPNAGVGVDAAGRRGPPPASKRRLEDVTQALTTPVRVAPSQHSHSSSGTEEFIQERIRRPAPSRPQGPAVGAGPGAIRMEHVRLSQR